MEEEKGTWWDVSQKERKKKLNNEIVLMEIR